MITKKFKVGDRVKFTREAKDRYFDEHYWHYANYDEVNLNAVYTVKSVTDKDPSKRGTWSSVFLGEGTAPHTPTYLLELAETQENIHMQKKDFLLALVQVLFPDYKLKYHTNCSTTVTVLDYPTNHRDVIEDITLTVRCSKCRERLVLTVSSSSRTTDRQWEDSDVEKIKEFLERCSLEECDDIWINKNENRLVMYFKDYPWQMVSEIKPLEQSPTKEEIQALQAEIQQLRAENEQLKACTIEIPQGVTSICLNLKG